jgi:hypothetical protein
MIQDLSFDVRESLPEEAQLTFVSLWADDHFRDALAKLSTSLFTKIS